MRRIRVLMAVAIATGAMLPAAAADAARKATVIDSGTQGEFGKGASVGFSIADAPNRTLAVISYQAKACGNPPIFNPGRVTVTTDSAGKATGRVDMAGTEVYSVWLKAIDDAVEESSDLSNCWDVESAPRLAVRVNASLSSESLAPYVVLDRGSFGARHSVASVRKKTTDAGTATPGVDFVPRHGR